MKRMRCVHTSGGDPPERFTVRAGGFDWALERPCDLETLWERLNPEDFGPDERMPYWAELWPAALLLAEHMRAEQERGSGMNGLTCLDLGCGLGLTSLVAARLGGLVLGMDYEWPAVLQATANARLNKVRGAYFTLMDWRRPALCPGAFQRILGGDILYEARFLEPLMELFDLALAPGGEIWVGEPQRTVSAQAWDTLSAQGWRVEKLSSQVVEFGGQRPTVRLWRLTR